MTGRGPFFDEGIYLLAGRTLVFRGENWPMAAYETWFNGSPYLFPALTGVVQRLGGDLVAVRLLNVGFLVLAVWGTYNVGRAIPVSRDAALLGAASFGLAGPVLFTGSFATYDMSALACSMIALWLVLAGSASGRPHPLLLLSGGAVFALAVLFKYVVIALLPIVPALILVRLLPGGQDMQGAQRWRAPLTAVAVAGVPMALIVGSYLVYYWSELTFLFRYHGWHLGGYGISMPAILFAILLYAGLAWLLASFGLEQIRRDGGPYAVGLILLGGSLIMPAYHLWKIDPLALFKQICWSLALVAPLVGVALASIAQRPRTFALVSAALILLAVYHTATLRSFYPDTRPSIDWLAEHVVPSDDPILVDNVWPYRHALAETFEGREWWVNDQWGWQGYAALPETWVTLIERGTFSYIVFERGGSFSGLGAAFDQSVMESVEDSNQYQLVANFRSRVSWGNSIPPPPFRAQLPAYDVVHTEIWARKE
ncbi:MAG: ArnT family glycosyltransferase [Dehalococcoidia bacterium]